MNRENKHVSEDSLKIASENNNSVGSRRHADSGKSAKNIDGNTGVFSNNASEFVFSMNSEGAYSDINTNNVQQYDLSATLTENFVKPLTSVYNQNATRKIFANHTDTDSVDTLNFNSATQTDSSKYFDNLINKIKTNKNDNLYHLAGGGSYNNYNSDSDSDHIITGKRMLKTNVSLSETSQYISENTHVKKSFAKYARELSRLIHKQKKQIYERIVKKIMDLIHVDDETARFYKTTLIRKVQDENRKNNKEVKGLELANAVEKLVTTATLNQININDEKKKILKWREEHNSQSPQKNSSHGSDLDSSEKNKSERKNSKKTKKSDSESSLSTNINLSEVSFDNESSD